MSIHAIPRGAFPLLLLIVGVGACDMDREPPRERGRMRFSSGEFEKGYKDGKRDAELAAIDANGAWLWYWVMEEEYRQGYDQGWSDGRNMRRIQAQMKRHEKAADVGQQPAREAPRREDLERKEPPS